MQLSATGRQRLALHFAHTALAFQAKVGEQFAATPSVAQTIYNKIVEDGNPFLQKINVVPVTEIKGERVGLSLSNKVASRTDTSSTGERVPKLLDNTESKLYECFATEFDVALTYAKIDMWAKFPDFASRYMQMVRQAMGSDMVLTGWMGTSAAATTNIGTNPLLQDVNIGWLQKIRTFNSASQYVIGTVGVPIQLGSTTFKNLDVLAHTAKQRIPVQFRERPDLVLLVGSGVMSYAEETYYELNGNTPTEKAVMSGMITKAYAGLPTFVPPFFPANALLITPLSNLSIYYQDSSVRRLQKDKPEKNQVQDFNSVNLGYVVEEEFMTSLVENITYA